MAWLVSHGELFFPVAVYFDISDRLRSLYCVFYISIHVYSVYIFACKQPHLLGFPCGCCATGSISVSTIRKVLLFHWLFPAIPSIMANSCLMGQYFCMSCAMWSLFCVANHVWCSTLRFCRCASWAVDSCMFCMDVHTDRSCIDTVNIYA